MLLGLLMQAIKWNAWEIPGDDDGLPQDWPPSAIFFTCFVMLIYLLLQQNIKSPKWVLCTLAVTVLFSSAYFGSYIYGYLHGPLAVYRYVFAGITCIGFLLAITRFNDIFARILLAGWLGFTVLCFFRNEYESALYGYIGGSFLLLALFRHHISERRQLVA